MSESAKDADSGYRCHSPTNDVATLLLTDPVINDRLGEVLAV